MRTIRGGADGQSVDGPVTVEAPDDVDVRIHAAPNRGAGDRHRSRDPGPEDSGPQIEDALIQGLNASVDSTIVADVRLSLPPEQRFRRDLAEPTRLRVQVAADEDAVVLMQGEDGIFTWVYPDQGPADGARPERRALREVTFTLAADDYTPNPTRGLPHLGAIGGWLVDKLTKPVRAIVLTFVADIAIDILIRRIEGGNKIGLVVLKGMDPKRWVTADPPAAVPDDLFNGQPKRVLLLVHGTFSNTRGSFGQLTTHDEGKTFLETAYDYYDAVLGFDHKTLADSVETNVEQIKAVLGALPAGTVIDTIAYSRGGLVYRVLAEEALPDLGWRKAVFVGCTNAGTHLASPENWRALADIYTNVIMAGAKFTATLMGGGVLNSLIELGIKSLGEFVTILPRRAVVEGHVPGLASMDPDGATVRRLNAATTTRPARAYYAISSDFEPGLDFGQGIGPALSRALLDKVTDDLWQNRANDLVVDTASMNNVGGRQAWMGQVNAYPRSGDCYHTIYFSLDKTTRQLGHWLITPDQDVPPPPEPMENGAPAKGDVAKVGDAAADWAVDRDASEDPWRGSGFPAEHSRFDSLDFSLAPAGRPRPRIDASISSSEEWHAPPMATPPPTGAAAQDRIAFNAAASMPQSPVAGSWTSLAVILSREPIALASGHAQAHATVEMDPTRRLRLTLRARTNCVLGETSEAVVDTPAPGAPVERIFQIKGSAPGPGEVWVEITQGADTLQRLVLQPDFAQAATAIATAVVTGASTALPMIDLRVWEERIDEGSRLRFLVRSNELGIDIEAFTTLGAVDRVTYVAQLYKTLENTWRPAGANFGAATQQIVNRGADLYRKLFPLRVQRALWKHRKQIGSIQVFSYAPTIPWEVCFLTQPPSEDDGDGPADSPSPSLEDGGKFLAELGLTRWLSNIGIAPARLSLRPGKALYCIPNYTETGLHLANLQTEASMLADTLGAKAISPHLESVLDVLRGDAGEDFDVLHFACHGQADSGAIWNSALLLEGEGTADRPVREALGVSDLGVARLTIGGRRPIVFLNACQAGTGGQTLGGSTGLAQVLVERGAGLLVSALWSVSDKTASTFAKTFYTRLQAGLTVTEAVRDARQAAKASTPQDFTWLAYTVFGHPYARVTP